MDIEGGIIFSIENVKQAESCEEFSSGILIEKFDLPLIEEVVEIVDVPVIASCRKGHFVEARMLEKAGVSMIDESIESKIGYINKKDFSIPFMCLFEDEGEASQRIKEGAEFLRTPWGNIEEIIPYLSMGKEYNVIASFKNASPHDIAMAFQYGAYASIVSSRVFHTPNPPKLMRALKEASQYYNDMDKLYKITRSISNILPSETNI